MAVKLLFTPEWLREKIAAEPDASCDAGVLHPEAPLQRYFVDHGVVHDRRTGKHIRSTDIMHPHEDGAAALCELLNAYEDALAKRGPTHPTPAMEGE